MIASLRRLGLLAASTVTDADMLKAVWPALSVDISLALGYTCRDVTPMDTPISVFGGLEDSAVGREDLVAWHALTRDVFQLVMMPGGHTFMDTSTKQLLGHVEQALRS